VDDDLATPDLFSRSTTRSTIRSRCLNDSAALACSFIGSSLGLGFDTTSLQGGPDEQRAQVLQLAHRPPLGQSRSRHSLNTGKGGSELLHSLRNGDRKVPIALQDVARAEHSQTDDAARAGR
jgi:hypothetical protein